jgi:serine/threonine protein kinase/tetratricopeptide (TPR) repeat protein
MTDSLERLRSALAHLYAIDRPIGSGGMATVYRGEDLKHGRVVAVKVLHAQLASTLAADRFLREIRIAAQLTHPHILPLYDSGEADGLLYYVMPLVDGGTLRARIDRERQLPLEDAVRIACEVAQALGHAHSQGVVHRDIKPENILFFSGRAMVADFGIAQAVDARVESKLTGTGVFVGTPAYMSPEQAEGRVDARSDIYSLGCVLYEMLAGHAPFIGTTPQEILVRHLLDPVPTLRAARSSVPKAVERVVARALAKQPVDRFANAVLLAEALRPACLLAAATPALSTDPVPTQPTPKSIAVLPFINLTADPENEYFCDGMTEEIINALSQVPNLRVAARTSSFVFKGRQENIRTIGEELKVSTALEGSVRRATNRLRITAQLIQTSNGYQLWSQRYDREMKDVFAIQDELAQAITDALKVQMVEQAGAPTMRRGTSDLEAYHLYLRGRHFWYARNMPKAIEAFEAAVAKDPNYALAHAGIADAYCVLAHYGFLPSQQACPRVTAITERAVAIDPTLAEAHCSLGLGHTYFGWDFREAERTFRKALSLKPTLALAHGWLGVLYGFAGRYEAAIAEANQALEDEPLSPLLNCLVCIGHFYSRRYDEAIKACQTALEVAPNFGPALWCLSLPYTELGRHNEAIVFLRESLLSMRQSPWVTMLLGGALARAGRRAEAVSVLDELQSRATREFIPSLCLGWIHLRLGEVDQAYTCMERAFVERNAMAWFFASWPGLEWMHSEPRWNALLEKFGVVPVGTEHLEEARVPLHARTGEQAVRESTSVSGPV